MKEPQNTARALAEQLEHNIGFSRQGDTDRAEAIIAAFLDRPQPIAASPLGSARALAEQMAHDIDSRVTAGLLTVGRLADILESALTRHAGRDAMNNGSARALAEQLTRRIAVENTMRVAQEIVANVEPLLVSAFTCLAADLAQAQAETARLRDVLKHISDNTHDKRSMREADAALKERA